MTLDISQFIANSVRTQSKIHHLDINTKAVKANEVPASVKKLITDTYGDKYLEDADYVAFFWGPVNKDNIDKLFNVVDKALGKSANKLTDKDFKKISLDGSESSDDEEDDDNEEVEDIEVDADEETTEQLEDSDDDEIESSEDDEDADKQDDEENDEESSEEQLNEDDEEETVEVKVEEKPEIPTSYFFLKITSK